MVREGATSRLDPSPATTADKLPDVELSFHHGEERNSEENATG
jgi:hypothetical protein